MVGLSHAIAPKVEPFLGFHVEYTYYWHTSHCCSVGPFQHNSSSPKIPGFLIILVTTYSMAHYDIFREQLAIKYPAYGHALWEPNPGRLYSPVEVGDVGYVREGKFHRLFNALLAADHPSHRMFGVPEYHVPLIPNPSEHIDLCTFKASHCCSYGISVAPAEPDFHAT